MPLLDATRNLIDAKRIGLESVSALHDAVREIGQVVESVQTADEVMRLAERHGIELPISSNVRAVLHGDITPAEGLGRLMAREQKPEFDWDSGP